MTISLKSIVIETKTTAEKEDELERVIERVRKKWEEWEAMRRQPLRKKFYEFYD
jgi:hypothetical protein